MTKIIPGLCVATPAYGGLVTLPFLNALLALQARLTALGIGFEFIGTGGDALITRARNGLAARFLATSPLSHMLFIDADIGFSPDQALRLYQAGKEIVGGIYPVKRLDAARLARAVALGAEDPAAAALTYVVEHLQDGTARIADGFATVRGLGGGFLCLTRNALETVRTATPALAYHRVQDDRPDAAPQGLHGWFETLIDPDSGTYISEDYAFCRRARAAGLEVWADLTSRLTHTGPQAFAGDHGAALALMTQAGL